MTTGEQTGEEMEIRIRSITGSVLWRGAAESQRRALEQAVEELADLEGAYLEGAHLSGAWLESAFLNGADLEGADLRCADLGCADLENARLVDASLSGAILVDASLMNANLLDACLRGANLTRADLKGANLKGVNLEHADLEGAKLKGANLEGAHLMGAYLTGADLAGANLTGIRDDLLAVLKVARAEAAGLLTALRDGRVDGLVYSGECSCLIGTIANLRDEPCGGLGIDLRPNSTRPAEVWFQGISRGDTPVNNPIAAITVAWIESWLTEQGIALPVHVPLVWRGDAELFARELRDAGVAIQDLKK
jgi:uncharacterized protein YjbI with pentapeptide repeats